MSGQNTIYLDNEGYQRLLKEIDIAQSELNEIQKYKGEVAIYQGDNWHDNPTLYQTEMQERMAITKLAELKLRLSNVRIVSTITSSPGVVKIGDRVTVRIKDEDGDDEVTFRLTTAFPQKCEVSTDSPMGISVLGKSIGDEVTYVVNGNSVKATILKIE